MKATYLNILVFISALTAIYFDHIGNGDMFAIFKPLTTVLVILIPLCFGSRIPKKYFISIVVGLVFCLMGDTFLLKHDFFIYGLLSFLIGHLIFLLGFVSVEGFKKNFGVLLILLMISGGYLFYLKDNLGELMIPVIVYMLVIVLMSWQGIGLYLRYRQKAFLLVAFGVLAFMLSDSILSFNKFHTAFNGSGILVLSTYWLAIALMANSTVCIDLSNELE